MLFNYDILYLVPLIELETQLSVACKWQTAPVFFSELSRSILNVETFLPKSETLNASKEVKQKNKYFGKTREWMRRSRSELAQ